jgi:hypothetical protein
MPPADAELKLALGSAGASPSPYLVAFTGCANAIRSN